MWYQAEIWADLQERQPQKYSRMVGRRLKALQKRCFDLALILSGCDSDLNPAVLDAKLQRDFELTSGLLFVAGSLDTKYVNVGHRLRQLYPGFSCIFLPEIGHALLTESPYEVASLVAEFVFKQDAMGYEVLELNTRRHATVYDEVRSTTASKDVGLNWRQELSDLASAPLSGTNLSFSNLPLNALMTIDKKGYETLGGKEAYFQSRVLADLSLEAVMISGRTGAIKLSNGVTINER